MGLIPGLVQWVKGSGIGCSCNWIQSLAWELPRGKYGHKIFKKQSPTKTMGELFSKYWKLWKAIQGIRYTNTERNNKFDYIKVKNMSMPPTPQKATNKWTKKKTLTGVPAMAQQEAWCLCCTRMRVWSLAQYSGLEDLVLLHYIVGHNCGLDLIPGPGTPCASGQPKKKEKQKKKTLTNGGKMLAT